MEGIFYGLSTGLPLGPYHPDEIGAQQRAKEFLKAPGQRDVYRVEAEDPWDARRKIDTHIRREKR